MANTYKVFLTGRDNVNWATDDDDRLTTEAIFPFCNLVPIHEAEIIHAVNWQSLLGYEPNLLENKYIIAHVPHDVRNMFQQPQFYKIAHKVNKFIVPTLRAKKDPGY